MIPCSNTPWENPRLVSLIHEYAKFDDYAPCWMQGDGKAQPFVMTHYGASAELEVCDLLYTLVRYLRPAMVVELGCHKGIGTYALARACQDSAHGHVYTCDIDPEMVATAVRHLGELCPEWAEVAPIESSRMMHLVSQADFLWLDCDYEGRMASLREMKRGAVACVHDTRQEPMLREAVVGAEGFEYVNFGQTHRGLSIIQKM